MQNTQPDSEEFARVEKIHALLKEMKTAEGCRAVSAFQIEATASLLPGQTAAVMSPMLLNMAAIIREDFPPGWSEALPSLGPQVLILPRV